MTKQLEKKLTVRKVLSVLIVLCIVRQFMMGNYHSVFIGILSLGLFMIPSIISKTLDVDIPPTLEAIIYAFIFAAEILGEINAFYVKIPIWDTMLHTTNGFLMAAIGFALVDIMNRSDKFSMKLSPFFLAFVAFCFSMTVGVMWEFFEFSMDMFFGQDMQKDWIINTVTSVKLDPTGGNTPTTVAIDSVVINGEEWQLGGYLDIGIIDTMKDLMVNFVGAVVFSVFGFLYVKSKGEGKLANSLIPKVKSEID